MKSPFPGMDPYLERRWLDVHNKLVTHIAESLNDVLPTDLISRSEERLVVEQEHSPNRIGPDVRVYEDTLSLGPDGLQASPLAVLEPAKPVVLYALDEPITEASVKIFEADGERLVTVIELLSPTNKFGRGLEKYRRKRKLLLKASVNVVEIDLQRAGQWRDLLHPFLVKDPHVSSYRVTIRRGHRRGRAELYPISMRSPLPVIAIPLRPTDSDVTVDLQSLFDRVYKNGRYNRTDYTGEPDPPFNEEDKPWADELLKRAGKR